MDFGYIMGQRQFQSEVYANERYTQFKLDMKHGRQDLVGIYGKSQRGVVSRRHWGEIHAVE